MSDRSSDQFQQYKKRIKKTIEKYKATYKDVGGDIERTLKKYGMGKLSEMGNNPIEKLKAAMAERVKREPERAFAFGANLAEAASLERDKEISRIQRNVSPVIDLANAILSGKIHPIDSEAAVREIEEIYKSLEESRVCDPSAIQTVIENVLSSAYTGLPDSWDALTNYIEQRENTAKYSKKQALPYDMIVETLVHTNIKDILNGVVFSVLGDELPPQVMNSLSGGKISTQGMLGIISGFLPASVPSSLLYSIAEGDNSAYYTAKSLLSASLSSGNYSTSQYSIGVRIIESLRNNETVSSLLRPMLLKYIKEHAPASIPGGIMSGGRISTSTLRSLVMEHMPDGVPVEVINDLWPTASPEDVIKSLMSKYYNMTNITDFLTKIPDVPFDTAEHVDTSFLKGSALTTFKTILSGLKNIPANNQESMLGSLTLYKDKIQGLIDLYNTSERICDFQVGKKAMEQVSPQAMQEYTQTATNVASYTPPDTSALDYNMGAIISMAAQLTSGLKTLTSEVIQAVTEARDRILDEHQNVVNQLKSLDVSPMMKYTDKFLDDISSLAENKGYDRMAALVAEGNIKDAFKAEPITGTYEGFVADALKKLKDTVDDLTIEGLIDTLYIELLGEHNSKIISAVSYSDWSTLVRKDAEELTLRLEEMESIWNQIKTYIQTG